jgi:hypothetical protein
LITIDLDSFGKGQREKEISAGYEVWFVDLKILEGLEFMVKNSALLGKWLFKLFIEDDVWQTLLKRKCIGSKALSQVVWKPGDSHFWAGLMVTEKFFFRYGTFSINDGS